MVERTPTLVDGEIVDAIERFRARFEAAIDEIASDGIDTGVVELLADSTKEIDRDLDRLYAGKFPKQCNTCGRVYASHEEYIEMTRQMRGARSTIYDDEDREVHEYRDCACGSSLLVLVGDRRDESPFGQQRRLMFDRWLGRLAKTTGRAHDEVAPLLRKVFRAALVRARVDDE